MNRVVSRLALLLVIITLILVCASWYTQRQIEARFPPIGRFLDVNGVRLHYTDRGSGTPIVLIHGANSNLRDFEFTLVPLLAQHFRVLNFDRPGYGYSDRPQGPWPDPGRLANLILSACERLGAMRPVVVGHSWSGSVVMSALLREPNRVAGGVLLAGVAGHWVGPQHWSYQLGDWPWLTKIFANTALYPVGRMVLPEALGSVMTPDAVPSQFAQRIGALLALRSATFQFNIEDMNRLSVFMQDESSHYTEIRSPLMIIHGTEDTLVPYWNHGKRLIPVIHDLRVELLQGRGHAPHHSDPPRVAKLISDFAFRLSSDSSGS